MPNEIDILIRVKGDAEQRVQAIVDRLKAGGPACQRLGEIGGAALQLLQRHGANAAVVMGGIGNAAASVGSRINSMLEGAVSRLISTAKWAVLAGAAFAGWQIKQGLAFNSQLEQTNVQLAVLYKSQARANIELARFRAFAKDSAFDLGDIAKAGRVLDEFGLSGEKWLRTAGDVATATGSNILEISRALAQFGSGREEQAARTFTGIGINLRAIQGLKWNERGQLQTPNNEATGILQANLSERFGGMMARGEKTFSGQMRQLMENISIARGKATETLFAGVRDRLQKINEAWDRIMDSPRVREIMGILQRGFDAALQYVDRLAARFTEVFDKTGSIGKALKAVWDTVWPDLKEGAVKFAAWLAEIIKQALLIAWKGFQESSMGTKAALGGAGALMLAPQVMSLLSALPGLTQFGKAAWKLGSSGLGAAGGMIGSRGAALPFGLENLTVTSTGGIIQAGGYASRMGGSGVLGALSGSSGAGAIATVGAVLIPLALAYVAGQAGAWGIGKWGDASSAALGRGDAGWGTRLLSRATGAGIDVDRSNAGARAGIEARAMGQVRREADAEIESKITRALQTGAAAWAQLLQIQERMTAAFDRAGEAIKGYAESYLDKVRTPEQKLAALHADLLEARVSGDKAAADFAGLPLGDDKAKAQAAGLSALDKEADLVYKVLGLEAERLKTIRDQNAAYGEQMSSLSYADRARAYALQKQIGGLTGQALLDATRGMGDQEMRLIQMNPEIKKNLTAASVEEATRMGVLAPTDAAEQDVAKGEAAAKELERKRQQFAPNTPEQMAAVQNKIASDTQAALGELKVKISSDDIKLVISADSTDKANQVIQEMLDKHSESIGAAVAAALKSPEYQAKIQQRIAEALQLEHAGGEAGVPR